MTFSEKLNEYMDTLECTAKDLCRASGLSSATVSRYRSGERVPDAVTELFDKLCSAIAVLAEEHEECGLTRENVKNSFLECLDINAIDKVQLSKNFNILVTALNINISKLCGYTNYNASTLFRIRNGDRLPSDPFGFAAAIAEYVSSEMDRVSEIEVAAQLLKCTVGEITDKSRYCEKIKNWLIKNRHSDNNSVNNFLSKLNEFDLNEYIKAIHFDELKVPSVPFQLPTSKTYTGLKDMMKSELDFLKATVMSKSMDSVIMYSDMPMGEMAKDAEFPKKWMFGMAMMLKKGLHLHQIHSLDRSFEEMMLGLESWIPLYMTGQISPYYFKNVQNNVFLHLLKVSGAAALSGEAIAGYHSSGRYYLTKGKDEVAYYRKRAEELLSNACPLMDIYISDNSEIMKAFLKSCACTQGKRRNILSSLPVCTIKEFTLKQVLNNNSVSEKDKQNILGFALSEKLRVEEVLKYGTVEDEVPYMTKEEFEQNRLLLSLSGMFYESDVFYTYEQYAEHLRQTEEYAAEHPNYILKKTNGYTFKNLQISILEGKWVMVSKSKSPAIHFVIHHPKLREAIENFAPPVVEDDIGQND